MPTTRKNLKNNLFSAVPLFAELPDAALTDLTDQSRPRNYVKGATIIFEGDPAHDLFIIRTGRVKVCVSDDQGRELILTTRIEGEYFGELALLDAAPRSANVIALEATEVVQIDKAAFNTVTESHPGCMASILRNLVARVRDQTESLRHLALVDVYGRFAWLLSSCAISDGDTLVIRPRFTQQDIASRIGASREMISRIMKDLVTGGYIRIEPDQILILRKIPSRW